MSMPAYTSFAQWYSAGHLASYVRTTTSAGGAIHLLEAAQPAGDMSDPAVPDIVLYQDLHGGSRVIGDMGGERFDVGSEKGGFFLSALRFANTVIVDAAHELRSLSFPLAQWQSVLDEATDGQFFIDYRDLSMGSFASPTIRFAIRNLWALRIEEGMLSRLLAQAAGCEILAELCRLGGAPFGQVKGGLAPWAERRSVELMRARLSEDISLDDLAVEAKVSPFHFARMFKQSVGVPPRVYLTRLRVEKACELLERTDLPITQIALTVGYSSSQVFARVFIKHRRMSPSDYRRAVRDPVRQISVSASAALETAGE
ncbi:transcriptional regulator, AraC family [Palleronia marisminoris]|uniref:Right origin-binding protein n=1 Tax=Palleronia marisminoris TaxID=315423 RepID=A0A1Y5TRE3_9RHOB|nr:AraC family transcriptional regulator [Palleronia marisminoris]SFH45589.1 transcriptional regulator, AraC family [Palleronia marisminoris]SLN67967.1 Right origin-binding protein [Palleronia marisminoris]